MEDKEESGRKPWILLEKMCLNSEGRNFFSVRVKKLGEITLELGIEEFIIGLKKTNKLICNL